MSDSHSPTTTISLGTVKGEQSGAVMRFLGLPYGKLAGRFLPVAPPDPWQGVRDATAFGPACPQAQDEVIADGLPAGFDEDCFSLNVWTPAADDGARPVMVWVHGGGLSSGSGAESWYPGETLAKRGDMVIVTINYRVGCLGWLHLAELGGPELAESGNLGLLDTIAALRWVREHIAAFGGDPGRVTVAGESAGGLMGGLLLAAPSARGLFHGVVLQSGTAVSSFTPERATELATRFLERAGGATPAQLQALPIEQLLAAQEEHIAEFFIHDAWRPVGDGAVLPAQPFQAVLDGEGAEVPVMVGHTLDELRYWIDYGFPGLETVDVADIGEFLAGVVGTERAAAIAAAYARLRPTGNRAATAILGDYAFRLPATLLASALAARQPVFAYLYEWQSPVHDEAIGAPHAIELPFLFNYFDDPLVEAFVGEHAPHDLAVQTQDAWIAFCRNGDPATASLPKWPRYDTADRPVMVFNRPPRLELDPYGAERIAWGESLPVIRRATIVELLQVASHGKHGVGGGVLAG